MKKYIAILLVIVVIVALCIFFCDKGSDNSVSDTGEQSAETVKGAEAESSDGGQDSKTGGSSTDDNGTGASVDVGSGTGYTIQAANPTVITDAAGIKSALGISLIVPESASNVCYCIISDTLGQVTFIYDGKEYCLRAQKTDTFTDVSGVYFANDPIEAGDLSPADAVIKHIENGTGVVLWYRGGCSYSVSMSSGASDKLLTAIYELVKG